MTNSKRKCSALTCDREYYSRGFCIAHYARWKKWGDIREDVPIRTPAPTVCSVEDCERAGHCRGFCSAHYSRLRRTGSVREEESFRAYIPTGAGKGRSVNANGYVTVYVPPGTPGRLGNGYMLEHRYVMQEAIGRPLLKHETIHHKNGDRADNRLENLELRVGPHGPGATEAHCHTCSCFEGWI